MQLTKPYVLIKDLSARVLLRIKKNKNSAAIGKLCVLISFLSERANN